MVAAGKAGGVYAKGSMRLCTGVPPAEVSLTHF